MKNQNDLIASIVFGVLGLIAFGIAIATRPETPSIAAPPTITVTDAQLPATAVVYGNALPGSGATAGGTGGPGGMMGGPMGGPSRAPGGFGGPGGSSGSYPGSMGSPMGGPGGRPMGSIK